MTTFFVCFLLVLSKPFHHYFKRCKIQTRRPVYFDFLHTNFIDSSGIGLVLGRYNQLKLDDRQLYLANLSKTSYKVFELSGMFDLMEYVEEVKG